MCIYILVHFHYDSRLMILLLLDVSRLPLPAPRPSQCQVLGTVVWLKVNFNLSSENATHEMFARAARIHHCMSCDCVF